MPIALSVWSMASLSRMWKRQRSTRRLSFEFTACRRTTRRPPETYEQPLGRPRDVACYARGRRGADRQRYSLFECNGCPKRREDGDRKDVDQLPSAIAEASNVGSRQVRRPLRGGLRSPQ